VPIVPEFASMLTAGDGKFTYLDQDGLLSQTDTTRTFLQSNIALL